MTTIVFAWKDGPKGKKEDALAKRAVCVLNRLLNDTEFRQLIRNAEYPFISLIIDRHARDATSADVETIVVTGREAWERSGNHSLRMDVVLHEFTDNYTGSVKGRTIQVDRSHFASWVETGDAITLAGLLLHEWLHLAGFEHECDGCLTDVSSVVELLVREHARELVTDRCGAADSLTSTSFDPAAGIQCAYVPSELGPS